MGSCWGSCFLPADPSQFEWESFVLYTTRQVINTSGQIQCSMPTCSCQSVCTSSFKEKLTLPDESLTCSCEQLHTSSITNKGPRPRVRSLAGQLIVGESVTKNGSVATDFGNSAGSPCGNHCLGYPCCACHAGTHEFPLTCS